MNSVASVMILSKNGSTPFSPYMLELANVKILIVRPAFVIDKGPYHKNVKVAKGLQWENTKPLIPRALCEVFINCTGF